MSHLTLLDPTVVPHVAAIDTAQRLTSLRGATVGFVNNSKVNVDLFISRLRPLLEQKYGIKPGVVIRKNAPKDELTAEDIAALLGCAAVVQTFGD